MLENIFGVANCWLLVDELAQLQVIEEAVEFRPAARGRQSAIWAGQIGCALEISKTVPPLLAFAPPKLVAT